MRIIYDFEEVCQYSNIPPDADTHKHLAKLFGVTERTVKNWESRNNVPSKYPMRALKKTLSHSSFNI